jgi:glycosyltransferase involved in cell wall biosynthesis
MKIVIITPWHTEKMGYSDNFLPKALASRGQEVHLISSTAQIYFNASFYKDTYEPFLGPGIVECVEKEVENYTLHRLPVVVNKNGINIEGLADKIKEIAPDVVQTYEIDKNITYQMAKIKNETGFNLYTANHIHASVFENFDQNRSIKNHIRHFLQNERYFHFINRHTTLCYPISTDCAEIAAKYFKVPFGKLKIDPLGTDTELFKPLSTSAHAAEREELRNKIGFRHEDIVCIYTGRITQDKSPAVLAEAIKMLHQQGHTQFKALFVGHGQIDQFDIITKVPGCKIHPFIPTQELPPFYRLADIGVWPKQESTSQIDAMAAGLPLVLSNRVKVKERIDGNGYTFEEGNASDLAKKIRMLEATPLRHSMAAVGTERIKSNYSWDIIAQKRIEDYSKNRK